MIPPIISQIEECNKNMNVYIELKAFEREHSEKISNHQSPDYMEDDYLALWKIIVENDANCSSKEYTLDLHFNNSEKEIDHFFCSYGVNIPPLEPKERYILYRTDLTKRIALEDGFIEETIYQDVNEKNFTFCKISMFTTGIWKAKAFLEPTDVGGSAGSWGFSLIEGGKYAPIKFKVRSKQELLALDQQKRSFLVSLLTIILIGVATILSQILSVIWQINKKRTFELEEQKELLNNIETQIGLVSSDLDGIKEELIKGQTPSYFVYKFKSNFYLTKLKEKINTIGTKKLKEELNKLEQKIDNINRIIELMQNAEILRNISSRSNLLSEITSSDFKYHKHSEEIIKKIKIEIKKLRDL